MKPHATIQASRSGQRSSVSSPLARAYALGPSIESQAAQIEAGRRIPDELLAELHAARMFRLLLPESFGGDEVEPDVYFRTVEQLATHDGSVAWNVFVGNSAALMAPFLAPTVANEIYGDPRALVSWGPPNRNRARVVPGGYRVGGEWDFASGCRHATWMGVHCQVEEPDGSLRAHPDGRPKIDTFLFRARHAQLIDNWHVIGLRGTASDGYRLDELYIPEAYASTRENPEARRETGRLYAFPMQGLYAVGVAGVALGIARAMLGELVSLAATKQPRGMAALADSATVQSEIAKAEAKLSSSGAWLEDVLAVIYAAAPDHGTIGIDRRAKVRLGCVNAIHQAIEVAETCYRRAGVDAIFEGSPFERRFRDIHTVSQQIQSRDAHYETVGQVMLGKPPAVFY